MSEESKKSTMTFADLDDWTGVYIDGVLVMQDHQIDAMDAVDVAIENDVGFVERKSIDPEWDGDLPDDMADLTFV